MNYVQFNISYEELIFWAILMCFWIIFVMFTHVRYFEKSKELDDLYEDYSDLFDEFTECYNSSFAAQPRDEKGRFAAKP